MSVTLIRNASLAGGNEVRSVLVNGDTIQEILTSEQTPSIHPDIDIDASGCLLFPGIIDDHVHFREPGLTHKADMASESRAAVAGGVTTIFDMPNCVPQTTTLQHISEKNETASRSCLANYSFYLGATKDNIAEIERIDPSHVCGVKLFMGSSTGGMLVDDSDNVRSIFKASPVIVAAHCEESSVISRNMDIFSERYGGEPPLECHPLIRSAEACYVSSSRAVELAVATGAHLHLLHISTERELSLLSNGNPAEKTVTSEVCPAHLLFTDRDYRTLGTRIKCNPAVKTADDRSALRSAFASGLVDVVGTDHAPHLLAEKQGGARSAASGMPVLPYSLPMMLELAEEGIVTIGNIVSGMCHNPALIFGIKDRGFIREGYKADLTLVRRNPHPTEIRDEDVPSKCGWSPFAGLSPVWQVIGTWVNGNQVYDNGVFIDGHFGEQVIFER